ncbi:SDR family NAD(P)-dependent oxidoreductase [Larkinella bovis]|uniref:SDR family NAD(P)-dependent oxidoreductase n=1 Tax=Larkinella bovis TaxID=683041 RepID=A0ABW0ICG5_9BACT
MHSDISSLFNLAGKTALITGGSSVLGYEAASILAAAGCAVSLTSRRYEKAAQAATQLQQMYGVETLPLQMDHTDPEQVAACAQAFQEWRPSLDILVNNAGGGSGSSIAYLFERNPKDIHNSVQTNLTGIIYCCKEFGKIMVAQKSGKIINIASIAGLIGRDRRMYEAAGMLGQPVDYAASKAGVIGLTRDLAGFLSPQGIRVNSISPGGFTGPERQHHPAFVAAYSDRTPLGRMGKDGQDLKGVILFLASPASDYVTGQNIVVDGGFSTWQ